MTWRSCDPFRVERIGCWVYRGRRPLEADLPTAIIGQPFRLNVGTVLDPRKLSRKGLCRRIHREEWFLTSAIQTLVPVDGPAEPAAKEGCSCERQLGEMDQDDHVVAYGVGTCGVGM